MPQPDLTFVFPCLNEQATLGLCIDKVIACLDASGLGYEIIVADNGSSDRSLEIARAKKCRVINVPLRGYGAALRAGIEAAETPFVVFADSDNTYLYEHSAALYCAAKENNAGMAIASRITGAIAPGAMPWLHRYLGTPVLTFLINGLFRGRLTDCNSGFRCIKKAEYETWNIRSNGMEFASELLIKALKAGTKTVEIPSGLNKGPEGRVVHLRTWRDGMRHLLFILSEKPALFEFVGFALVAISVVVQFAALLIGPTALGEFNIFDLHTQALALITGLVGAQFYVFGCSLYLRSNDTPGGFTKRLINLDEGVLFFLLVATLGGCGLTVMTLVFLWVQSGFSGLHHANHLLGVVHLLSLATTGAIGLLSVHTLKKSR